MIFGKDKSQRDLCIYPQCVNGQGKMQFNPDPHKQANEVYFSRKSNADDYILIKLNDSHFQLCES